jgi:hypothetical protein
MTRVEVIQCLEALRSARSEIEAMEDTFPEYCTTGRLIDQLKAGERILAQEKASLDLNRR